MTLTRDKAVQIFANLIKDPYFQKTRNKSREEVVWDEAKQRARQAHNNDIALSMAASGDEFGAVKSFLAFFQKADTIDFSSRSRKKVAKLGKEHTRIKGLYEVAQDTKNPAKAAGAKKLLLQIAAQSPELVPTKAAPTPKVEETPKEEPKAKPTQPKQAEMADIVPYATDEDAEEEQKQVAANIIKVNAAMRIQMGGKDETGKMIPAQVTKSGRKVLELAQGPHVPPTTTGKIIALGRFGLDDEFSKVQVKDKYGQPVYYINPDTNEPEEDADTGEPIPVLMDIPIYNTLETAGHFRHPLKAHIKKLRADYDKVKASLNDFKATGTTHPSALQAGSAGEVGGNAWQGFRSYIDDISSRDAYDNSAADAISKMEAAMSAFNDVAVMQSRQLVRVDKRESKRQKQDHEQYTQSMTDALRVYHDSINVLEKEYQGNEALDVQKEDSKIFRKAALSSDQAAQLSRLWFVQQYAKSQNLLTSDGEEVTPFTDFMSRFRFAPDEYMPDTDDDNQPIYTTVDDKEVPVFKGKPATKHQQSDFDRVNRDTARDVTAAMHWSSGSKTGNNSDLIKGLFEDIANGYREALGPADILSHHLKEEIARWAPSGLRIVGRKVDEDGEELEAGHWQRPPQKTVETDDGKRISVGKSQWISAVDGIITEKRTRYRGAAKEARKNTPAALDKKRKLGDVVKQKFIQTFKKLNKVEAKDPDEIDIHVAEPIVEAYPSVWTALNSAVNDEVKNESGSDYEEQMENYMERRQQTLFDDVQELEDGLTDPSHPVYELLQQMRLPISISHKSIGMLDNPQMLEYDVVNKEPTITKALEKIQKSRAYIAWNDYTNSLHTAMETFLTPEEDSYADLLSLDLQELVSQETPEQQEILSKGIDAYNFIHRHLDEKHGGRGLSPEFNLGRVQRYTLEGKKKQENVNYEIEAFAPETYGSVDDIMEHWWNPLVTATFGGGIATRIATIGEWVDNWKKDLALRTVKPSKAIDESELAQETEEKELQRLGWGENDHDEDELTILNEFDITDEEKPDTEEDADTAALRDNIQKMYEAIQERPNLAAEFCGTSTEDGKNTGAPAAFTVDSNGLVQFNPTNFNPTSDEGIKDLEELLTTIGLEGIDMPWTGTAKGTAFINATKKLSVSTLSALLKERLSDEDRNLLDTEAPGLEYTYNEIINLMLKTPDLPQAKFNVDRFMADVITPLLTEAQDGIIGKYDLGEGEYVDELPPLGEGASIEERRLRIQQKDSLLESINDSTAMVLARQVQNANGLSHYGIQDAEEIAPILFEAIKAGGLERQQAFDAEYGVDFDDQGNAITYSSDAFYQDVDGKDKLKVWEGFNLAGYDNGIAGWVSTNNEYGVFINQLKRMFAEHKVSNRTRKNVDKTVSEWAEHLVREFLSPNDVDEPEAFPDVDLFVLGEDDDVPSAITNHIMNSMNDIQNGLQSFRSISPNAGMLLHQPTLGGRNQSREGWFNHPENQEFIDQWQDLFGADAFTTWKGHRRLLSFLGRVNKAVEVAASSGIEMPPHFPSSIFLKERTGQLTIHPDIFKVLAEEVLNIPQSSNEWENFKAIDSKDTLLTAALAKGYAPEFLQAVCYEANMFALPDFSGLRLVTREQKPEHALSENFWALLSPHLNTAFESLGQTTKATVDRWGLTGYEGEELLAKTLTNYSLKLQDRFDEKMTSQAYSSALGTPFAPKSIHAADDIVSKLLQTLQEEIDLIGGPESGLYFLVQKQDGTPGALVTRMNKIKKEYINSNSRDEYRQAYWEAYRQNPAIPEEERNMAADRWSRLQLPYDDSVKMNTIASVSKALREYGYANEFEVTQLDETQQARLEGFQGAFDALKGRIDEISSFDFNAADNPTYLESLQSGGIADLINPEVEEGDSLPLVDMQLMTSDLVGNVWNTFNQDYPDLTIAQSNVVFSDSLMNYLKSPYELDEAGQPIPELDEAGNSVMEDVLDDDDEPTGQQQQAYVSKIQRVDDEANGDPDDEKSYLKGMDDTAKRVFTSRHYGDFTEPMARIRQREKFLKEIEVAQHEISQRVLARGEEQAPASLENLKADIQRIHAGKKRKTNAQLEAEAVAKDEQASANNPHPGYSAGVGEPSTYAKTHAELVERLHGMADAPGSIHRVFATDDEEFDARAKPRLSPDAHSHFLNAGLVTPYDKNNQWAFTEQGQHLMNHTPRVKARPPYKQGGFIPVEWAEAIGGSAYEYGNDFHNSINAAPVEPSPVTPPEIEEGGVEPIQNMLYKMGFKATNPNTNLEPSEEDHDALFEILKSADVPVDVGAESHVPFKTRKHFTEWIANNGLPTKEIVGSNGRKRKILETPFVPQGQSIRRLSIVNLNRRNIWPFHYNEEGRISGIGGGAAEYEKLLEVLYQANQHFTDIIENQDKRSKPHSQAFIEHLTHRQNVTQSWIDMLHGNITKADGHPNNIIDDGAGNAIPPVNINHIVANRPYNSIANEESHLFRLRGKLIDWAKEEGYTTESDESGMKLYSMPQEGESEEEWKQNRGEGVPINVQDIANHLRNQVDENDVPLYNEPNGGAFKFVKFGKGGGEARQAIHQEIRQMFRDGHGMPPFEVVDEPPVVEDSDEVIARGRGPDAPPITTTEQPVLAQPEQSEQPELPGWGKPQKEEVRPTGQQGMTEVDGQLPLAGFEGTPQPEGIKPSAPTGGFSFREQKIAQHLKDKGFSDREIENYVPNFSDAEANKLFGQHLDERLKSTPDTTPAMEDDKRQQYEQEIRAHSQEMHGTDIHDSSKFNEMNDKQLTDAFHQSHKDISTQRSKKAAEEKQNFANDVVIRVPPLKPDATPDTIMDRARVLMSEYLHHRHSYDKPALAHFQAQMQDMQARAAQAGVDWEDTLGTELEQFDGEEGRAMFGSPEHKAFVLQQTQQQQKQQQGQQEEQAEYDGSLDDRFAEASKHEDYHPGEFIKPMIRNDGSRTYVTHDYNNAFTGNQMSAYASNDPAVQDIMAGGDMDSFTDVDGNPLAGWHHPASGSTVHPHVFEKLRSEVKSLNRNSDINTGLYIPDGTRYTNLYDPAPDAEIPFEHSLGKGSFWMGQDGNLIRLDRQAEEFEAHPHNAQHDHAPHKVVSDWHTRRIKQHLQQAGEGAEEQFNKRVAPISTPGSPRAQQAHTASQTPPQRPEKAIDRFMQRQEGVAPQPSFNPMDYMTNRERKKQQMYAATEKLQLPALSSLARFITREKPLDKYHTEQLQAYNKENKVNELYQTLRSGYYGVDYINAPEEAQKRNPYATPPDVFYGSTPDAKARAEYERQQMRGVQPQPVAQGAGVEQGQASQERQVAFPSSKLNLPKHWETTE